jgi:hypothetical protein
MVGGWAISRIPLNHLPAAAAAAALIRFPKYRNKNFNPQLGKESGRHGRNTLDQGVLS